MISGGKIAILQPNYIPWKGYFDIIRSADHFIFLDDVQYTSSDWRNRNIVKTPSGPKWISIPVIHKLSDLILDVKVRNQQWRAKHWNTLVHNYRNSPCFDIHKDKFRALYMESEETSLSKIDIEFIKFINSLLGIETPISCSSDYRVEGRKSEKLLSLCKKLNATSYISGPSARAYLDEELFRNEGIAVEWFDYAGYKEYRQQYAPFEHKVTILDLLFNEGPDAINYMKKLPGT